jgi:hypothetical protein
VGRARLGDRGDKRDCWPGRGRGADDRRWGEERWAGRPEEVDREWIRKWGYVEGRGAREPERDWGRGWGFGRGAGAGSVSGRPEWGGSDGYEPGGYGWSEQERSGMWPSRAEYGFGWRVRQGPHVGRGPRGYRRSDERIREDICERMSQHGELDASDIEVTVLNGEVTLQGTVPGRADKRLAEDLVEDVSGVHDVHNQLRVAHAAGQEAEQPQGRPFRAA